MVNGNGKLPTGLRMGPVALTTPDQERSRIFYEKILGLRRRDFSDGRMAFHGDQGPEVVVLYEEPDAVSAPGTTGLYHLAIKVPGRKELAQVIQRVSASGWGLQGASDHGVSEALYMADADGNGVEIYRDRPREEWPRNNGELEMVTRQLDLHAVLAALPESSSGGGQASQMALPAGTELGHVHLKVGEIPASERFYCEVLGFDLMQRYGAGASFVSAGGYHHHVGFNIWHGAGAPPPPPGSVGLRYFTIHLPSEDDLQAARQRLERAAAPVTQNGGGLLTADPAGNRILLKVSAV